MEANQPGTSFSTILNAGDQDFANAVNCWMAEIEADSDFSSDDGEEYILSEHESDSELSELEETECREEQSSSSDENIGDDTAPRYYRGKNRMKWSAVGPSRNVRTPFRNIIFPAPVESMGTNLTPSAVFFRLLDEDILNIILKWTNKKISEIRE